MKKFFCIFALALAIIVIWYDKTDDIDFIVDPVIDTVKSFLHLDKNSKYTKNIYVDSEGGKIKLYTNDKTIEFEDVSYYNTSLFADGTYEIGDNGDYIVTISSVKTEYYTELVGSKLVINQPDVATINAFGTTYKKQ